MQIFKSKPLSVFCIILFLDNNSAFMVKSPIKQIAVMKALQSSITETIAFNLFDQNSLYKELFCECNNSIEVALYVLGFSIFSYIALKNNMEDNKIKDVTFYKIVKKKIRLLLFIIMLFLNKDVRNAW